MANKTMGAITMTTYRQILNFIILSEILNNTLAHITNNLGLL